MNASLSAALEALLFVAPRPLSGRVLSRLLKEKEATVEETLRRLREEKNQPASGIHLLSHDGVWQFVTNPTCADAVRQWTREEFSGDLTRPQLETLTIVAYRGPVSRPDIEQIRGVQSALILRNLLIRGLIEEREEADRLLPVYVLSAECLRHLGLRSIQELPDYEAYHTHPEVGALLGEEGGVKESKGPERTENLERLEKGQKGLNVV